MHKEFYLNDFIEKKPDWKYFFVASLNQYVAINEKTDILYTEDKTRYTADECHLLSTINYQLPKQVHILKKLFNGEIVSL